MTSGRGSSTGRARPRLLALAPLDGCLRVTIGTPDENDRFLGALRDVLDTVPA